jgi:hypothetical protein
MDSRTVKEGTFKSPFKPVKIRDVDLAFPASVVGKLLPLWDDIPKEFKDQRSEWSSFVNRWFCAGSHFTPEAKEEFDKDEVWRHLQACMGSFEPEHNHKIAGVACLMSLWFKPLPEDWRKLANTEVPPGKEGK